MRLGSREYAERSVEYLQEILLLITEPLMHYSVHMHPDGIATCPYTSVFAERLVAWFNKLKWPDVERANHDKRPCTLLELYADFVLSTHTLAPAQ